MKINVVKMTRDLANYYHRYKQDQAFLALDLFGFGVCRETSVPVVIADVVEIVAKSCERK